MHEDYLNVVVHYLDSKWILQKKKKKIKLVDTRHTANAIWYTQPSHMRERKTGWREELSKGERGLDKRAT